MAKPFTGNPNIAQDFAGRWARGLTKAVQRLAHEGCPNCKNQNAYPTVANLVVDVLGEDFLNIHTLYRAVQAARPDPLQP